MSLERARELLESARDVRTILDVRTVATVAADFARARRESIEVRNRAIRLQLDATRALGAVLRREGRKRGETKMSQRATFATLSELGITRSDASRAKQLAEIPKSDFDRYVQAVLDRGELLTAKGAAGALRDAAGYDSNEYYTTRELVEAAREVMGAIDLDPASCELAQTVVRARRYFTKNDDGLSRVWRGRVLLNSPFEQPLESRFTTKLIEHFDRGHVTQCVRIMNATVETRSFHACAGRGLTCLPLGRINFLIERNGELVETSGNRYAQAIVYMGPHGDAFRRVFGRFGLVGELRSAIDRRVSAGWNDNERNDTDG